MSEISGIWSNDTSNKNWWNGSANGSWTTGGEAVFGNNTNTFGMATVTLASNIEAATLTFNAGPEYWIEGGNYDLSNPTGTLTIVNNRTQGRTSLPKVWLRTTITGGPVTFRGNSSTDLLRLSYYNNNTFTGTVTLDAAGLYLSGDGALGHSSNDLEVQGNSAIFYGIEVTHGAGRAFRLGSGATLALLGNDNARVTIGGPVASVSGTATLQIGKAGNNVAHDATLTAAATFSGTLRVCGYLRAVPLANLSPNAGLELGNSGNHTGASGDSGSMLEATGTFDRSVGSDPGQVRWDNSPTNGSGGFAAVGGDLTLLFGGTTAPLTWGAGSFLPNGNAALVLQTDNSTGKVYFQNGIALNGSQRTIRVNKANASPHGPLAAHLDGPLSGDSASGIRKAGDGVLLLRGANTYGGITTVSAGYLVADHPDALGSTANGTVVEAGGTLAIAAGRTIVGESITIHGNGRLDSGAMQVAMMGTANSVGEWQGDVRIGGDGARVGFAGAQSRILRISGRIANDAMPAADTRFSVRADYGTVAFTNDTNSFAMPGGIWVPAGKLSFTSIRNVGAGNSALGAPATAEEGRIELGDGTTSARLIYTGTGHSSNRVLHLRGTTGGGIIEASGAGPLVLEGGLTLAAGGAKSLTLTGTSGHANEIRFSVSNGPDGPTTLWKTGTGRWLLVGDHTHTGTTYVSDGNLELGGNLIGSPVSVSSTGSLYGAGTCGSTVTVATGGRLIPGGLTTTGALTASGFSMASGSHLVIHINQEGVTCSRIVATGSLAINGVNLWPDVVGGLKLLPANTRLIIVSYPGATVSGTFAGNLIDGSIIEAAGNTYRLNYAVDTDANGLPDAITLTALGDDYGVWTDGQNLDPSEAAPDADPDGDGIRNLLEFVLGGLPKVANSGILPVESLEPGYLVFRFNRSSASRGVTTQVCEWCAGGLGPWKQVPLGYESYGPDANGVTVTIGSGDPHPVTVRIPANGATTFARLKVSYP